MRRRRGVLQRLVQRERVRLTAGGHAALGAVVLLAALVPALAGAARPPVCPDGRFHQAARILPGSADGAFDTVVVADGRVSIASGCGETRARLKARRGGDTRLRARWRRCGDLRRVRLAATITADGEPCRRLVGTVRARKTAAVPVAATRTACGDGFVDAVAGEACDPPGPSCDAGCAATGPIAAPARTWTWVPFADAFCADGSTTGLGVNPGAPGARLVVYLMGGGACWDENTCYRVGTAFHIEGGYDAAEFAVDLPLLRRGIFDRTDPANPFRDDGYVFVPYCTGDVHAGSNPAANHGGRLTRHVGFRNMTAFLARVVPTFPDASRVILAGSSAGGYGALANWWQAQAAFGDLRVDLLDDSGPTLPAPYAPASLVPVWRAAWNLAAIAPPGCAACAADLAAVVPFYGGAFAGRRAALLSYTQDAVIAGFNLLSGSGFESGLDALAAEMAPYDLWRHFFVAGSGHTLLGTLDVAEGGVTVREFVTRMVTDDPGWTSVAP